MKETYLCIHGHFYQPPRENPWLEEIEYQPSAFPYHDWNERVARECYGPNSRARLEGEAGHILKLINNYEYMSFDFGPTLLSWLKRAHPWIYEQILAADRSSRRRFQGHGNAMAQVYNHIIMPLASTRDKLTQIRWGLADFEYRFGRPAEGMWLAETAVDTETLALMAEEGVRFTVLAPTQARAVRSLASPGEEWEDVSGERIDTTQPYRVSMSDSSFMDVFFYDGGLSKAVAYEKVLTSGSAFLARIENGISNGRGEPCLVNVATDGESYGHHFKFGDMALAWIFQQLEKSGNLRLSNYAWFLEQFPSRKEVRIIENSSWSCAHGIERWRSDCGCSVNHREGWNQAWRTPLREAMDWLARELSIIFEEQGGKVFKDPWAARDDYIMVLLDTSSESRDRFLERHVIKDQLNSAERVKAFELMESQRMALYMYTSCGWFFDDISGLEASQVLMYADRAMHLVREWTESDLESGFLSIISRAKSNDPDFGDGTGVYERRVRKGRMSPERIAANYSAERLVYENHEPKGLFSRHVYPVLVRESRSPGTPRVSGKVRVTDPMTGRGMDLFFTAGGKGPPDFYCYVRGNGQCTSAYGFGVLAPDTRRNVVKKIAGNILKRINQDIRQEEEGLIACMGYSGDVVKGSLPDGLYELFHLLLRGRFLSLAGISGSDLPGEVARIRDLADSGAVWNWKVDLDGPETRDAGRSLANMLMHLISELPETRRMVMLMAFLDLAERLSLKLDLWECQNLYWDLSRDGVFLTRLSGEQVSVYKKLGERLGFTGE